MRRGSIRSEESIQRGGWGQTFHHETRSQQLVLVTFAVSDVMYIRQRTSLSYRKYICDRSSKGIVVPKPWCFLSELQQYNEGMSLKCWNAWIIDLFVRLGISQIKDQWVRQTRLMLTKQEGGWIASHFPFISPLISCDLPAISCLLKALNTHTNIT